MPLDSSVGVAKFAICWPTLEGLHINLVKLHPERIPQKDKELINDLDFKAWFELNIESIPRNSKCCHGAQPPWLGATSGKFGNLTPLKALKLHSPCIFENITVFG